MFLFYSFCSIVMEINDFLRLPFIWYSSKETRVSFSFEERPLLAFFSPAFFFPPYKVCLCVWVWMGNFCYETTKNKSDFNGNLIIRWYAFCCCCVEWFHSSMKCCQRHMKKCTENWIQQIWERKRKQNGEMPTEIDVKAKRQSINDKVKRVDYLWEIPKWYREIIQIESFSECEQCESKMIKLQFFGLELSLSYSLSLSSRLIFISFSWHI